MTIRVSKDGVQFSWQLYVAMLAAVIGGAVRVTMYLDKQSDSMDKQSDRLTRIETKLDAFSDALLPIKKQVDINTAVIALERSTTKTDSMKLQTLLEMMPTKQRISYWNEIRTRNRIELRPIP